MKANKRGFINFGIIVLIVLAGAIGGYILKSKSGSSDPTKAGQAVIKNLESQEKNKDKINEDQKNQAKIGQQYVQAESSALEHVKSDEPAILLLKQLNPRAGLSLANGLGPLDIDQQNWANNLVLNALSEEAAKRALAEAALSAKDKELQLSIVDTESLVKENNQLQDNNQVLTQKLVQEDATAVGFRTKIYAAVGLFLFIVIGLPILSAAFPILKGFTEGMGALISPFLHKAKIEAESLAKDSVGVIHEVEAKVTQAGAIAKEDFAKIKSDWISESNKNVSAYDKIRRELNLI